MPMAKDSRLATRLIHRIPLGSGKGRNSVSGGTDVKESGVHRVCQPNVVIGFSKSHASFKGKQGIDGKYGPGRLVGQELNDPVIVGGKMREAATHPEDAMAKDVRDVARRGAVKQKGWRRGEGRRLRKLDAVAVYGAEFYHRRFQNDPCRRWLL